MQVVTKIRKVNHFYLVHLKEIIFLELKKILYLVSLQQRKIPKQVLIIYNKLINDGYTPQDIMVLSSQNKKEIMEQKLLIK